MKRKPFRVERNGDKVVLDLNARGRSEFINALQHAAAYLKRSPADLIAMMKDGAGTGINESYERAPANHGQFSLGQPDALRSIVKSTLELVALATTNATVRTEPFRVAREFVLGGGADFSDDRMDLDSRALPIEKEVRDGFGPAFHLASVTSDAKGRTVGYFRVYGFVAWQIVLAEADGPANICLGLICDPLSSKWSDEVGSELSLSTVWLDGVEFDGAVSAALAQDLLRVVWSSSFERETGRIVEDVFEKNGVVDGAVVDDPAIKAAIFAEIGDCIAHIMTGVPLQRSVGLSQVERWLAEQEGPR